MQTLPYRYAFLARTRRAVGSRGVEDCAVADRIGEPQWARRLQLPANTLGVLLIPRAVRVRARTERNECINGLLHERLIYFSGHALDSRII